MISIQQMCQGLLYNKGNDYCTTDVVITNNKCNDYHTTNVMISIQQINDYHTADVMISIQQMCKDYCTTQGMLAILQM